MTALRRLVYRHHRIAALLIMAALALKLVVPAGFMPTVGRDGAVIVQICSGMGPTTMEIALPGSSPAHDRQAPVKADMPCAFAGLAMPMLNGVDPLLLATALAFIMAMAIGLSTPIPPHTPVRLRPPLRGPPIRA